MHTTAPTTRHHLAEPRRHRPRRRALGASVAARASRLSDALLAHAQADDRPAPDAGPLASGVGRGLVRIDRRTLTWVVVGVLAVAAVLAFTGGPAEKLTDAFERAASADLGWVAAGVGFEALSFLGYIVLFWLVASRATEKVRFRQSAEISLAGAAATRLLPTAGLGGVALTLWALARSGLKPRSAVQTLLTFLVLVYTVFMGALAVAGILLATGVAAGDGPVVLMLVPAAFGTAVIVTALVLARRRATVFAPAVRSAIGVVGRGDVRVLGAVAWWGFDLALLAAMFHAIDAPPAAAVLVLAYFTGAIANTIPLPGLVAGGTTGMLLAFGVDAAVALPAVLAYRAVALWVPAALGAFAIAGLRRTAIGWAQERRAAPALETATVTPFPVDHPLAERPAAAPPALRPVPIRRTTAAPCREPLAA